MDAMTERPRLVPEHARYADTTEGPAWVWWDDDAGRAVCILDWPTEDEECGAMTDLAEWLLAQIAEDERRMAPQMDQGAALTPPLVPEYPARVLAECEAKRRIIGLVQSEVHSLADDVNLEWGTRYDTDEKLLRLLALPYADRPGFRDEWRI